jgi:hypothetical protein
MELAILFFFLKEVFLTLFRSSRLHIMIPDDQIHNRAIPDPNLSPKKALPKSESKEKDKK